MTIKMPLTEHLSDLRKRIVISLVSLLIGFVISFAYSEVLFRFLTIPLRYNISFTLSSPFISFVEKNIKNNPSLVFLAPTEAFWMHIKISMIAALILSLPVILSQLWKFISPGLLHKEKRYVVPFVLLATVLFLVGAAFCFFIVLPFAMGFLLTYKLGDFMMPMLSVGQYVDFCLKFVLAFGAVFELPIIIIFFTKMGFVTPQPLAK